jgi:hypothetical protein
MDYLDCGWRLASSGRIIDLVSPITAARVATSRNPPTYDGMLLLMGRFFGGVSQRWRSPSRSASVGAEALAAPGATTTSKGKDGLRDQEEMAATRVWIPRGKR